MAETFQVVSPCYTGPFDLLLAAIKDGKIDVFDVSISQITSAYFEYLRNIESVDINTASEFLLIAAWLLEIKSKKLLPQPEEVVLKAEEEQIESELMRHIEEYKVFKQLAEHLKDKKESFRRVYSRYHREVALPEQKDFYLKDVNLTDLVAAFKHVWDSIYEKESVRPITDDDITLSSRIEEVLAVIAEGSGGIEFEELFMRRTRVEVVVTFLAILELAKRGRIKIMQGAKFGGIRIFGN